MMTKATKPIPEGFHSITPHLIVDGAGKAVEFYKNAFGAEEGFRMSSPDGQKVMHAEIRIGNSPIMLADEFPEYGSMGPKSVGGSPVVVHLYVNDVDATVEKAVQAGAKLTMPVQDMFWGDRYGKLQDPFGHEWSVATHTQDLTENEIAEAAKKAFG